MKLLLSTPAMILSVALFAPVPQRAQAAAAPAAAHEHHAVAAPATAAPSGAAAFRGKGDGITTCPASGDPVDPKLFELINGRKIYFCCEECIAAVKKNPELYLKADSGVAPDPPAAAKTPAPAAAPEANCADKPAKPDSLAPASDTCASPEAAKAAPSPTVN
jgi:YHS domain-containing protein